MEEGEKTGEKEGRGSNATLNKRCGWLVVERRRDRRRRKDDSVRMEEEGRGSKEGEGRKWK